MTEKTLKLPSEDIPTEIPKHSSLALIGAGPIGIEAAAWAAENNIDFVLLEKGAIGHHMKQWGHVRLFSPFGMNHSEWGTTLLRSEPSSHPLPEESSYLTGCEYVTDYLEPLGRLPQIRSRTFLGTKVLGIGKEGLHKSKGVGQKESRLAAPFRLLLRNGQREMVHHARAVIDCSGVYSCPQALGSGNIPAPGENRAAQEAPGHLHYGLPDILGKNRERFSNRRVLLIGGGYSAATSLECFQTLASQSSRGHLTWVNTSQGGPPYPRFEKDPLSYRDQLANLGNALSSSSPPWLRYLEGSTVQEISSWPRENQGSFQVTVATPRGEEKVQVDEIIVNTGFQPDSSLYRQLQVHQCYATTGPIKLAATLLGGSGDCLAQESQGIEILQNPEPNFFILGSKSYGTNSTFLLSHGLEQIRTVMPHLTERI